MADWLAPGDYPDIDPDDVARANRHVDYLIAGAVYVANDAGEPASARQREACKTAAELLARGYRDDEIESGAVSLGSLQLPAITSSSPGSPTREASQVLRVAGLGWQVR